MVFTLDLGTKSMTAVFTPHIQELYSKNTDLVSTSPSPGNPPSMTTIGDTNTILIVAALHSTLVQLLDQYLAGRQNIHLTIYMLTDGHLWEESGTLWQTVLGLISQFQTKLRRNSTTSSDGIRNKFIRFGHDDDKDWHLVLHQLEERKWDAIRYSFHHLPYLMLKLFRFMVR